MRLVGCNPRLVKLLIYLIRVSSCTKVRRWRYLEAAGSLESVWPRNRSRRVVRPTEYFFSLSLCNSACPDWLDLLLRAPFEYCGLIGLYLKIFELVEKKWRSGRDIFYRSLCLSVA